jgi:hypothetical protein
VLAHAKLGIRAPRATGVWNRPSASAAALLGRLAVRRQSVAAPLAVLTRAVLVEKTQGGRQAGASKIAAGCRLIVSG